MAERSIFDLDPDQLDRLLSIGADADKEQSSNEQEAQADQERVASDGGSDVSGPQQSGDPTVSLASVVERPGGWIGQYKLLSVLGEGGMGMVYLTEQERPIKRRVALKVIKPGMDSKRVIARFEAERQALALLDHPNIAHVYDAGTTQTGRPYFVMEYVEGLPITEYCDRHKLIIEDRLGLFLQVCHAVHHAHQKGIIHRDIKPSNILVSMEDDRTMPKIIDFGVAKAIAQPLTERTLVTEQNQLFGTPEYMSPEQADMANEDIDTRSDIYSLGVLLYVLLTGVLPFDSTTFREGGIEHIRELIRETDPKTPSTRLTKLGDEAVAIAQNRRTEIQTLARHLRKELEWIPLKAMRKERSERYRSASELADDIENYLKGAPLIAGPPSTIYRLKKTVRRHKALVAGVFAVLTVSIIGTIVSLIFALGQARARAEAERQAKISEAVSSFLRKDLLASVSPTRGKDRDVTVRSFLDTASESLIGKFENEPLIEASIRHTLGYTYKQLGESEAAEPHLERALQLRQEHLGTQHLDTLNSVGALAALRCDQGRCQEAAELLEKAMSTSRHVLGDEHVRMLGFANTLGYVYYDLARYDDAEHLYLKSIPIARRVLGEKNEPSLYMAGNLGHVYMSQGRYDEAERQLLEVLRLSDKIWYTRRQQGWLARVYIEQKRYAEAERLYLEILPLQRRLENDFFTMWSVSGLARVYTHLGKYDEAEKLFAEALGSLQRMRGPESWDTLRCMNGLARLYTKQERYEEAESLLIRALEICRRTLGDDHPWTLTSMNGLSIVYKEQNDYTKAEPLLLEAVEGRRLKLGDTHPHTKESLSNLIELYEAWNKPEKSNEWRAKLPQKNP